MTLLPALRLEAVDRRRRKAACRSVGLRLAVFLRPRLLDAATFEHPGSVGGIVHCSDGTFACAASAVGRRRACRSVRVAPRAPHSAREHASGAHGRSAVRAASFATACNRLAVCARLSVRRHAGRRSSPLLPACSASSLPVSGADQRKIPYLPERIEQLAALASNLSWTWSRSARLVFSAVDPTLWRLTRHNPLTVLRRVDPMRLNECARDPEFLKLYDAAVAHARGDRSNEGTWYAGQFPGAATRPIAYFCAEFGLHHSVPIYSGGLGVLAATTASVERPRRAVVGVGRFYRRATSSRLRLDGWQEDSDERTRATTRRSRRCSAPTASRGSHRDLSAATCTWRVAHAVGPGADLPARHRHGSNHPDAASWRASCTRAASTCGCARIGSSAWAACGVRALASEPAAWHANRATRRS